MPGGGGGGMLWPKRDIPSLLGHYFKGAIFWGLFCPFLYFGVTFQSISISVASILLIIESFFVTLLIFKFAQTQGAQT